MFHVIAQDGELSRPWHVASATVEDEAWEIVRGLPRGDGVDVLVVEGVTVEEALREAEAMLRGDPECWFCGAISKYAGAHEIGCPIRDEAEDGWAAEARGDLEREGG